MIACVGEATVWNVVEALHVNRDAQEPRQERLHVLIAHRQARRCGVRGPRISETEPKKAVRTANGTQ